MLRKHYKEGASVVTHFRVSKKINKINSQKDQKKIIAGRSAQKMVRKIGQGG